MVPGRRSRSGAIRHPAGAALAAAPDQPLRRRDQPDQYRITSLRLSTTRSKTANIRYALEQYHPSEALQTIRTPPEVLVSPREGTCLDLAALFCGLCEAYELLPILIVIDGHALAAVSLTHGVRDWNGYRPGRELLPPARSPTSSGFAR